MYQEQEETLDGENTDRVNVSKGAASAIIDNFQTFGQNVFQTFKKFCQEEKFIDF